MEGKHKRTETPGFRHWWYHPLLLTLPPLLAGWIILRSESLQGTGRNGEGGAGNAPSGISPSRKRVSRERDPAEILSGLKKIEISGENGDGQRDLAIDIDRTGKGMIPVLVGLLGEEDLDSELGLALLGRWVDLAPADAAEFVLSRGGEGSAALDSLLAARWTSADPDAALEWIVGLPDGSRKEVMLATAGRGLALVSPVDAIGVALTIREGSDSRASLLEFSASQWAAEDPVGAAAWVEEFSKRHRVGKDRLCSRRIARPDQAARSRRSDP